VPCLDGPYADIEDSDGFRESAENANMIGCDGKWAIHPSQIEIGNEVFAPDPETAERAKRIVDAYAEAMEEGKGAVSVVDGRWSTTRRPTRWPKTSLRRPRRPGSSKVAFDFGSFAPIYRLFGVARVSERQYSERQRA